MFTNLFSDFYDVCIICEASHKFIEGVFILTIACKFQEYTF